ncbi:MAG: glycosyltransferase family 4 protein [Armatimonadetes bacterium]|nr:glycosyltransferase family 4 protein [Armatimonadota bacterium]
MHIGINALLSRSAGSLTYLHHLLPLLPVVNGEHTYTLFLTPEQQGKLRVDYGRIQVKVCRIPLYRSTVVRHLWHQIFLPSLVRRHRIDVLFSLESVGLLRAPCPSVFVLRFPYQIAEYQVASAQRWKTFALHVLGLWSARRSDRVIVVSEYLRDALRAKGFPLERMAVVHHGRDEAMGRVTDLAVLQQARQRYGINGPYLLAVSSIYPHKNYGNLVKAFALLCQGRQAPLDLLIAGRTLDREEGQRLQRLIAQSPGGERVKMLGEVPWTDLSALYSMAEVFVFPSFVETFGHPLVEAMSCGAPVAASRASAIPEICGDAAVYFDPYDVHAIAAALEKILDDPAHRTDLVVQGYRQVQRFSWQRTVEQTLRVLESVAGVAGKSDTPALRPAE